MLEKKLFEFETKKDILITKELIRRFWAHFYKNYRNENGNKTPDTKLFLKIGSLSEPIKFDFHINYIPKADSIIYELDDIAFVSDALRTAKYHRVISSDVCRIVDEPSTDEGNYILVVDGKPAYNISIGTHKNWIYAPVVFGSYDQKAFFQRDIILNKDGFIEQVGLELSVANKKNQKLFVDFYKQVLGEYEKLGLKVAAPKPNKK